MDPTLPVFTVALLFATVFILLLVVFRKIRKTEKQLENIDSSFIKYLRQLDDKINK